MLSNNLSSKTCVIKFVVTLITAFLLCTVLTAVLVSGTTARAEETYADAAADGVTTVVIYDYGDGRTAPAPVTYNEGETYLLPDDFTPFVGGLYFLGWEDSYGDFYSAGEEVSVYSYFPDEIVYTAVYGPAVYQVGTVKFALLNLAVASLNGQNGTVNIIGHDEYPCSPVYVRGDVKLINTSARYTYVIENKNFIFSSDSRLSLTGRIGLCYSTMDGEGGRSDLVLDGFNGYLDGIFSSNNYLDTLNIYVKGVNNLTCHIGDCISIFSYASVNFIGADTGRDNNQLNFNLPDYDTVAGRYNTGLYTDAETLVFRNLTVNSIDITAEFLQSQDHDVYGIYSIYAYDDLKIDNTVMNLDLGYGIECGGNLSIYNRSDLNIQGSVYVSQMISVYGQSVLTVDDLGYCPFNADYNMMYAYDCSFYGGASVNIASSRLGNMFVENNLNVNGASLNLIAYYCETGLSANKLCITGGGEISMTLEGFCEPVMISVADLDINNGSLSLYSLSEEYPSGLEATNSFNIVHGRLTFDFTSSYNVLNVSGSDVYISDSSINANVNGECLFFVLCFAECTDFYMNNSTVNVNAHDALGLLLVDSLDAQITNCVIDLTAYECYMGLYFLGGEIIDTSISVSLRLGVAAITSTSFTACRCTFDIDLGDPAEEGDIADVLFAFYFTDADFSKSDINIRSTSAGAVFFVENIFKLSHSSLNFNGDSRLYEDGSDGSAGDAVINEESLIFANVLLIEFSEVTLYSASSVNFLTADMINIAFSQVTLKRGDMPASDTFFVSSTAIYIIGSSLNITSDFTGPVSGGSCILTDYAEIYLSSVYLDFMGGSGIAAFASLKINNPDIFYDLAYRDLTPDFIDAVALSLDNAAEADAGSYMSLPESMLYVKAHYGIFAALTAVYNSLVITESVITGIRGDDILFYFADVTVNNVKGDITDTGFGISALSLSVIGGVLTVAADGYTDVAVLSDFVALMSAKVDISGGVRGICTPYFFVDAPLFTGEADDVNCFAYYELYMSLSGTVDSRIPDKHRAGYGLLTESGVIGLPSSSVTVTDASNYGLEGQYVLMFGGSVYLQSDKYGVFCDHFEMFGGVFSAEGGTCDMLGLGYSTLHNGVKEWCFNRVTNYSDDEYADVNALNNSAKPIMLAAFINITYYFDKEAADIPDSVITFAPNSANSFGEADSGALGYSMSANIALGGSQLINMIYGTYSAYHEVNISLYPSILRAGNFDYPESVLVPGYISQREIDFIYEIVKSYAGITYEYPLPGTTEYTVYQQTLDMFLDYCLNFELYMEVYYATYSVGYVTDTGYSFADYSTNVKHSIGEVWFKVKLDNYYAYAEGPDAIQIIGNYDSVSYNPDTGIYTISGVTSDLSVSVKGVYLPTVDISVSVVDSLTDFTSVVSDLAVISGADSVVKGTAAVLSISGWPRGYAFKGWYDSDKNLLSTSKDYSHTYTDDAVIYAVITERPYGTVVLSGGNLEFVGISGTSTRIYQGKDIVVRAITPSGKKLTGIYADGVLKIDDSTSYSVYYTSEGDEIIITAQFEDVETGIAIGVIGGTIDGATTSGVYEAGTTITVRPSVPDGYRFSFWALQSAPNTSIGDSEILSYSVTASSAVIVAKFIKINSATFGPGSGTGDNFVITVDEGNSKIFPDNLFTSDSGFIGWTDGFDMYQPGDILTLTSNTSFTAVWDSIYTIRFLTDTAGVSGTTLSQRYINGTKVTLPSCMFARTGYTFAGWLSGGVTYQAGTEYTVSGNADFTALWNILTYSVTFPDAGAKFTVAAVSGSLPTSFNHGGSVAFKIEPAAGYYVSDVESLIEIECDGEYFFIYYENTGVYLIYNIQGDIVISVNTEYLLQKTSALTLSKGAADAVYLSTEGLTSILEVGRNLNITADLLTNIENGILRTGYKLVGLNINGTVYTAGGVYTATEEDAIAVCVWKKLLTVSFTALDSLVTEGGLPPVTVCEGDIIYLPENPFTAAGGIFIGWVIGDGKTDFSVSGIGSLTVYECGDAFEVDGKNVIFAAVFERETYSVRFENTDAIDILNGASVYRYGDNANFTFTFKGYYMMGPDFYDNFIDPENVSSFYIYERTDVFGSVLDYTLALFGITGDVLVRFNTEDIITLTADIRFFDNLPTSVGSLPDDVLGFLCGTEFTLPALNKTADGLFFAGWQDWETGNIYSAGDKVVIEYREYGFVALWGLPREISFSGGQNSTGANPATVSTFEGRTVVLPNNSYSKDGYAFLCWSDGAQNYSEGASYTVGRNNVVITAVWQPTYAITFSSAIGSGTLPSMGRVIAGTRFTLPEAGLSSDDYKFLGWTDGSIFYVAGAQYTVGNNNVSFTALWVNVYRATFSGGENTTGTAPVLPAVVADTTIILPANSFIKAGHLFMGWSDTETMYPAGASYVIGASGVAFTAVWERLTVVTFDGNNQTSGAAPAGASVLAGTVITLPANTFVKDGYVFKGWEDGNALYQAGVSYTVGAVNVLLAASWERLTVVNFNADHKRTKGETPDGRAAVDGTVIILPENTYSRNNRTFVGWTDGTNVYAAGATYILSGDDVTLTPVWERNMTVAGQIFLILFLAALAGGGFCLYWFVLRVYKINFSFKLVKRPSSADANANAENGGEEK